MCAAVRSMWRSPPDSNATGIDGQAWSAPSSEHAHRHQPSPERRNWQTLRLDDGPNAGPFDTSGREIGGSPLSWLHFAHAAGESGYGEELAGGVRPAASIPVRGTPGPLQPFGNRGDATGQFVQCCSSEEWMHHSNPVQVLPFDAMRAEVRPISAFVTSTIC